MKYTSQDESIFKLTAQESGHICFFQRNGFTKEENYQTASKPKYMARKISNRSRRSEVCSEVLTVFTEAA